MAQDSYPTQADKFKKWSEAMLRGATVGKPTYSQQSSKGMRAPRHRRRKRFRKRKRQRQQE